MKCSTVKIHCNWTPMKWQIINSDDYDANVGSLDNPEGYQLYAQKKQDFVKLRKQMEAEASKASKDG